MDKESQFTMILAHLKEVGPITQQGARRLCNCERLAARIHVLRKRGIPIRTDYNEYINESGNRVRYGIYSLEESQCSIK
jgi:hypothetical protein